MPEAQLRSSTRTAILFVMVCLGGLAALLYFANSAALQSTPAYSTFNTGPDGAKLVFDALRDARLVQVSRQFKSVSLQKPHHATVLFLGVEPLTLTTSEQSYFDELERSAENGNCLVLAVTNDPPSLKPKHELLERTGVRFVTDKNTHTSSIDVDKSWKPLPEYSPYVWQRDFGQGSIILVGEAGRLTNKGIATSDENRHLLQQLISNRSSVVFEEAHLGIRETGSIAGLARHYHLQGFIAGLILLAALFVWSRSVSFPPMPPLPEKASLGVDARSMLVELMSRHLKGQLMAACVAEWNRTRAHAPAIQVPEENNPVVAYTKLQESLAGRTSFKL